MSISNEAIEAAARAIYDVRDDPYDDDEWEEMDSTDREECICQARAALTSAAPYIQAAALRDAAESFQGVMIGIGGRDPRTSGAAWLRARAATIEGESE